MNESSGMLPTLDDIVEKGKQIPFSKFAIPQIAGVDDLVRQQSVHWFIDYHNRRPEDYERLNLPRVVLLPADGKGVGHYRMFLPGKYVDLCEHAQCRLGNYISEELIDWADIFVCQRMFTEEWYEILDRLHSSGKGVVFDLDDDIHTVPRTNPAWGVFNVEKPDGPAVMLEIMKRADVCTFSTRYLADIYQDRANGELRNVTICPNYLDLQNPNWNYPCPEHDGIWVGYSGSTSHVEDMGEIKYALEKLVKDRSDVTLVFGGYPGLHEFVDCPDDRKIIIGYTEFEEYPRIFSHADIGLAPLSRHDFNASKSVLKLLDVGAHSIPTVASDRAMYRELNDEAVESVGEDVALFADTPKQWYDQIVRLIDDPGLRDSMGHAASNFIRYAYNFENHADVWWNAWKQALRARGEGVSS